jgi:iron uptake system component EfeO
MSSTHVALLVPAGLALLGLAAGCGGKSDDKAAGKGQKVAISLTADGCNPAPTSIPAGATTFEVKNVSADSVSEAELLKDDLIMGEKENLTPGLSGTFSLNLKPGKYSVYCPNAKKDTWDFQVTGTAASSALSPEVQALLTTATTQYHDYVTGEVDKLVTATGKFTAAVKAGDIERAKPLFAPARYFYEEVEPVAESFGDLDPEIDARAGDVDDPAKWTGFHRLEKALWQDKSLKGMTPVAAKLDADVAKLKSMVGAAKYQPAQLANGATDLLNEVASSKITGEEDRYSHTDLSDFQANIDGGKKAFDLLKPALDKIDPQLASTVETQYKNVLTALGDYKGSYAGSQYVDYSTVSADKRKLLTQKVDALAEPLSQVAAKVNG